MTLTKYFTPIPSPIMTVTTIMLAVFITVGVYGKETESTWYAIGGLALYSEDLGELPDDGAGVKVGAGVQLNETFGAELVREFIPDIGSVGTSTILNAFTLENAIMTSGYVYSSVLGTARIKFGENNYFNSKIGLGYYYFETEFRFHAINVVVEDSGEGFTPVAAFGIQFPIGQRKNLSTEISATHYFKAEVKTTGYGLSLRYQF